MRHPHFLPAMGLAALMSAAVLCLAVAPAMATGRTDSEAVRDRDERSDNRERNFRHTVRRPAAVIGAGRALALAAARDNRLASVDDRLEVGLAVQPNGAVTAVRVTQRP